MNRVKLSLLSTAAAFVLAASSAIAQTSQGILTGTVRDTTGAVLPKASIVVTNEGTHETRRMTAGADGGYRFDALTPGFYHVHAEAAGFTTLDASHVRVSPSLVMSYDPKLTVGSQTTTVDVQASVGELNTENGTLANTISDVELNKVPIFSLNPVELATTIPGVQIVRNSGMSNGEEIQVSGARPRANNFLIDGQEINDTSIGGQALLPQSPFFFADTVVFTHNPPAEYGRASGGVVNLISQAGSNQFHGQVWELYTGSGLNALDGQNRGDFYSGSKPRYNQHQYGFAIGGPIVKNKLFAFGGVQYSRYYGMEQGAAFVYPDAAGIATLRQIAANTSNAVPAAQATKLLEYLRDGAYLTTYGAASGGGEKAAIDQKSVCPDTTVNCDITMAGFRRPSVAQQQPDTQWNVRVDYVPHASDTFFYHYLHDRASLTPDFYSSPSDVGFDIMQGGPSEVGQGGWTHIFTPHLLNELRGAETRLSYLFSPLASTDAYALRYAPQLTFAGAGALSDLGYDSNFPQGRYEDLYQIQDTLSWTIGKHTIRVGGDIGRQLNKVVVPQNNNGIVAFTLGNTKTSALSNYLLDQTGASGSVSRSFGPNRFDPHLWRIGAFFQDDYHILPDLTLNLGIRYDYFTPIENSLPYPAIDPNNPFTPIQTYYAVSPDKNNIAPRIGFAYQPHGGVFNGNTVIRGGLGVFFDSDFSNIAYNSASSAPNSYSTTTTVTTGVGVTGATTTALSAITPELSETGSVLSVDKNLVTPYTYEYNLGIEQKFSGGFTGGLTYVGSRGVKLFANRQFNYFDYATEDRLDTDRGAIVARGNYAGSNYNGLETYVERKFNHGFQVRATYTFSKTLDNSSEVFTTDSGTTSYTANLGPDGFRTDYGNSAYDHRHFASILYIWSPEGFHSNNRVADIALNIFTRGWTISGTEQFQSGTYGTFNAYGVDTNGDGSAANDRPIIGNKNLPYNTLGIDGYYLDTVASPHTSGVYYDAVTDDIVTSDQEHFLLQHGPNSQFLNQEVHRNTFENPGAMFNNIAVEKSFAIPSHVLPDSRLTLRAESQNFTNHNNTGVLDTAVLDIGYPTFMNRLYAREALGRSLKLWAKFQF